MKLKIVLILFTIFFSHQLSAQSFTISGSVKDSASGEALMDAIITTSAGNNYIDAYPNNYGFYSLSVPKAGEYKVRFTLPGFITQMVTVSVAANTVLNINLVKKINTIAVAVIKGTKDGEDVSKTEMSVNKLDIGQIKRIPALLGEVDIVRSLQLLPGVSTVGEGASGFNVRGGNIDQNLVLLDEAPVFNSSHLFGFFSVFNPDVVRNVTLVKGGIPAAYGGRLSSVLDVRSKEGNIKEYQGTGGVGAIFSRFAIEGPIKKNKSSFIVAGRRSYIDVLAKPFLKNDLKDAIFNFWDVTAKVNYVFSPLDRVFVSSYFGRDKFAFPGAFQFDWGSQTLTARWNHTFNSKLFMNSTAIYSKYDYRIVFGSGKDQFDWNSDITNYSFKTDLNYFINNKHSLDFGVIGTYYNFRPGEATATASNGIKINFSLPNKFAFESGIYVDEEFKVSRRINLKGGFRLSYFNYLGKGKAYYYKENAEDAKNQPRELLRTETFGSNKSIANYLNPEPRFSAKFQLDSFSSIKASYNRMAQYIHLISNTTASVPLDVWLPSTNNIKPEIADQIAIGYFRNFGKKSLFEFSVEGYYKALKNQINYIDGASLLLNETVEGELLYGTGRAYGAEFYLKKASGKFTGWLSYTIARTELIVKGINNNEYFPSRFDRPHNINLVLSYDITPKWIVSSTFTYQAGTPATFPTSQYSFQGYNIPHNANNSRNDVRIPAYHRLDISAIHELGKFKRWKKWSHEIVFGAYNVYNRRNPFSIYFQSPSVVGSVKNEAIRFAVIGSIVPSITYNFKF